MRGDHETPPSFWYCIDLEELIEADHPLRAIKRMVDDARRGVDKDFRKAYSDRGRRSVAPERLLKTLLRHALYSIRSEVMCAAASRRTCASAGPPASLVSASRVPLITCSGAYRVRFIEGVQTPTGARRDSHSGRIGSQGAGHHGSAAAQTSEVANDRRQRRNLLRQTRGSDRDIEIRAGSCTHRSAPEPNWRCRRRSLAHPSVP